MFSAFQTFGKLGALASSVARAWSPLALWPDGISSAGMWISPRDLTSEWQDSAGTTPVSVPGTVADSSNPVGLALDIRAGATVLTDPGNHMLQSTSAARPLLSARVNLLTYTEDFTSAAWTEYQATVSSNATTAPDGTLTADLVTETVSANDQKNLSRLTQSPIPNGVICTISHYVKANGCNYVMLSPDSGGYSSATFDISAGTFLRSNGDGQYVNGSALCEDAGDGWFRISAAFLTGSSYFQYSLKLNRLNQNTQDPNYAGDGVSGVFLWGVQYELGTQATDYQAILTNGSTYPSTGFPIAQLYDGVDDGMATAAFAAGTLIDGMDCMIVVRRDSAANMICGFVSADTSKYFGVASSGYAGSPTSVGCGSPSVLVDGASITDERLALKTALTTGDFHILEYQNLDMSGFTGVLYGGTQFGLGLVGGRGDILLFPSTTPTADKDAARQWLADYYGVTLS